MSISFARLKFFRRKVVINLSNDVIKVFLVTNGCDTTYRGIVEVIMAEPRLRRVESLRLADVVVLNLCAMCSESFKQWEKMCEGVAYHKEKTGAKVIAGGCAINMLSDEERAKGANTLKNGVKLDFADVLCDHKNAVQVFCDTLRNDEKFGFGADYQFKNSVATGVGMGTVVIAKGCNRRCGFCKTHYLNHWELESMPEAEVLRRVRETVDLGLRQLVISGENTTEYGVDIGTNLKNLLTKVLEIDGIEQIDMYGLCLDEMNDELVQILKHPKFRRLQLEPQSLNDLVRKSMKLAKKTKDVLAILDALSEKALIGNIMTGYPNHSASEFMREMKLVRSHHLYFLNFDTYVNTKGVPGDEYYKPLTDSETENYENLFFEAVGAERALVVEKMKAEEYIEAFVLEKDGSELTLLPSRYTAMIKVQDLARKYKIGDAVRAKVLDLKLPPLAAMANLKAYCDKMPEKRANARMNARYFDPESQELVLEGKLV